MKKWLVVLIFLILAPTSIFVGVNEVTVSGLMEGNPMQWLLLAKTRIPRTISLILAGGMLSISGRIMQHFMQNKFVSANTIGMMDSARLGILVVMLFYPTGSSLMKAFVAFLFSYAGVLLFLSLSRLLPKGDSLILPLAGVMFGNVISAIAIFFAYHYQLIQNMSAWLQGNFATVMEGSYELIYLTVPVVIVLYVLGYQITVAGLGEELSTSLGMNYQRLQFVTFAFVAYGEGSRFAIVHDTSGFAQADDTIEASTHGQNVSYEYILEKNPDILFVVDRTQAIGGDTSNNDMADNELVKQTNAGKNNKVIQIDPQVWSLAGSGLESSKIMIDDVNQAFD